MNLPTNDKRQWYREVYLRSDHWAYLRAAKLARNPTCERCPSLRKAEPHHVRYRNIFDVTLDDLISLCRKCHKAEHRKIDAAKSAEKSRRKSKAQRKRTGDTRKLVNAATLGSGLYPVMWSRFGVPIVTTRIKDRRYAALREALEKATNRFGENLIGAPIPVELLSVLGIRL